MSGVVMICIEWWSFEIGAFLAGIVESFYIVAHQAVALLVYYIPKSYKDY